MSGKRNLSNLISKQNANANGTLGLGGKILVQR